MTAVTATTTNNTNHNGETTTTATTTATKITSTSTNVKTDDDANVVSVSSEDYLKIKKDLDQTLESLHKAQVENEILREGISLLSQMLKLDQEDHKDHPNTGENNKNKEKEEQKESIMANIDMYLDEINHNVLSSAIVSNLQNVFSDLSTITSQKQILSKESSILSHQNQKYLNKIYKLQTISSILITSAKKDLTKCTKEKQKRRILEHFVKNLVCDYEGKDIFTKQVLHHEKLMMSSSLLRLHDDAVQLHKQQDTSLSSYDEDDIDWGPSVIYNLYHLDDTTTVDKDDSSLNNNNNNKKEEEKDTTELSPQSQSLDITNTSVGTVFLGSFSTSNPDDDKDEKELYQISIPKGQNPGLLFRQLSTDYVGRVIDNGPMISGGFYPFDLENERVFGSLDNSRHLMPINNNNKNTKLEYVDLPIFPPSQQQQQQQQNHHVDSFHNNNMTDHFDEHNNHGVSFNHHHHQSQSKKERCKSAFLVCGYEDSSVFHNTSSSKKGLVSSMTRRRKQFSSSSTITQKPEIGHRLISINNECLEYGNWTKNQVLKLIQFLSESDQNNEEESNYYNNHELLASPSVSTVDNTQQQEQNILILGFEKYNPSKGLMRKLQKDGRDQNLELKKKQKIIQQQNQVVKEKTTMNKMSQFLSGRRPAAATPTTSKKQQQHLELSSTSANTTPYNIDSFIFLKDKNINNSEKSTRSLQHDLSVRSLPHNNSNNSTTNDAPLLRGFGGSTSSSRSLASTIENSIITTTTTREKTSHEEVVDNTTANNKGWSLNLKMKPPQLSREVSSGLSDCSTNNSNTKGENDPIGGSSSDVNGDNAQQQEKNKNPAPLLRDFSPHYNEDSFW